MRAVRLDITLKVTKNIPKKQYNIYNINVEIIKRETYF